MSQLEGLPAELRSLVLWSIPDLTTLRSLVHASPVLHAQYRHDRDGFLRACLARDMDGFFNDARATNMSRIFGRDSAKTKETITKFLDSYNPALSTDIDTVSSDCLYRMAAFHISVVQPLASIYVRWALTNIAEATAAQIGGESSLKLSRSEEIRIYRAIYRHETFYNVFGRDEGPNDSVLHTWEILGLFFYKFEPWESEAIWCINVFLENAYEPINDPLESDMAASGPRTSARPLQSTKPAELRSAAQQLLEPSRKKDQTSVEARYAFPYATMPSVLSVTSSHGLRVIRSFLDPYDDEHDERDEAEARRDTIEFRGDDDDGGTALLPPVAWVRLWNGNYSHLYGQNVPATVQRWGYVMWDARRWDQLGALDLVPEQWQAVPHVVKWIEDYYNWSPTEG